MDFSQFKAVDKSNTKVAGSGLPTKVQEFSGLKYKKVTTKGGNKIGKFTLSNDLFAAMGLSTNALRQFVNGTTVVIGVVANEKGKILKASKKGEKGKSFKSDILEADLTNAGLISGEGKQFLSLTKVADTVEVAGIPCSAVYSIAKGAAIPQAPKAEKAETAPASAPVAAAPAEDWN